MSLALYVIHYFISSSWVITIIIHQLHLPVSYGNEDKGYTVKTLSQVLTPAECENYMNNGILPPSVAYSYDHHTYIQNGNNVRINNDLGRQMRKQRLGKYKIVPRWKYLLGKFVPDLELGGLIQNTDLLSDLIGKGNQEGPDSKGDEAGQKEEEDGDDKNNNKLDNLAKKALPNFSSMSSLLDKGKGKNDAGDTRDDATGNEGGHIKKLNEIAKKAYDRVPSVGSLSSLLSKDNNDGNVDDAINGGGFSNMAKNAYSSVPSIGSLFGNSNDADKGNQEKSTYANVKDTLKKTENEVVETVENYILSLIPGGKAAEKVLEAKEKLGKVVKKIPKFKKKKKKKTE